MKFLTTAVILCGLATPAFAGENGSGYMANAYPFYGYGSAAAIFQGSYLKAGRLGYKVDSVKENSYYPGFVAGNPCDMVKK